MTGYLSIFRLVIKKLDNILQLSVSSFQKHFLVAQILVCGLQSVGFFRREEPTEIESFAI